MKTKYNFTREERKLKRLLILIFLIVCAKLVTAQEYIKDDNGIDSFPKINSPRYILKIAPLALIGPYEGSSLRMGMEYRIKEDWSGYTEFIHYFFNTGEGVKTEFKWWANSFQPDKHSMSRDFVSVEFFYKHQCYSTSDTIIMPNEKYNKEYNVTKAVECLTVKYGTQVVYRCGITVDFFIGLGVRVKQAANTLAGEGNKNIQRLGDYGTNRTVNMAGNYVYPNFDAGIKIGYVLGRRSHAKN